MKAPIKPHHIRKEKAEVIVKNQKISNCCGPTCCGGSNDKTNNSRKEK
jgi:hypothetical protein